jgi:hypothetical protein
MFKSSDVAYRNPSNFNNMSCIFGIGYGFLLIRLFNSLKSVIDLSVVSFLGTVNAGKAHSDLFTLRITPMCNMQINIFYSRQN